MVAVPAGPSTNPPTTAPAPTEAPPRPSQTAAPQAAATAPVPSAVISKKTDPAPGPQPSAPESNRAPSLVSYLPVADSRSVFFGTASLQELTRVLAGTEFKPLPAKLNGSPRGTVAIATLTTPYRDKNLGDWAESTSFMRIDVAEKNEPTTPRQLNNPYSVLAPELTGSKYYIVRIWTENGKLAFAPVGPSTDKDVQAFNSRIFSSPAN